MGHGRCWWIYFGWWWWIYFGWWWVVVDGGGWWHSLVWRSRSLEFEKRTDQNFITQKSPCRKGTLDLEEKETVKAMSKGGYVWIYFGFCGVVVHFLVIGRYSSVYILAGGEWWWMYFGWWCKVVDDGGWWWVVVDIFWLVVDGGGWWWNVVGRGGSWHSLV